MILNDKVFDYFNDYEIYKYKSVCKYWNENLKKLLLLPKKIILCNGIFDGNDFIYKKLMIGIRYKLIVFIHEIDELKLEVYESKGCKVYNYINYIILPGLIDCHSHPTIWSDNYQINHLINSSAYKALHATKMLEQMLKNGWTTIRTAGDACKYYPINDIKRAIKNKIVENCPNIYSAGHYISITGGGGDINQISCEHCVHSDGLIVDGKIEMQKAVRKEIKYGSDWIKLLVTGSYMAQNDIPKHTHMSFEEIEMAVEEAKKFNIMVMAHAHGADGIIEALKAGVKSIEHGTFINDEGIRLMKEKNSFLVPTLFIGEYYKNHGSPSGALNQMIEYQSKTELEEIKCLKKAVHSGVKVAVGTDFVGWDPKLNVEELVLLHIKLDLSIKLVLKAATSSGAELLGINDKIGYIKEGFIADLIAVPKDIINDITYIRSIHFVMFNGEVIIQK